jgi:hypothetical protein
LAFNFVQAANRLQRLFCQLTFIRHVQIEKLAAGVSHAADFGHAFLEASFVASEGVTYQLAIPGTEEVARMLTGAARAEIVDHGLKRRERRSAVSLDISTVSFLLSGRKRLHRSFVGVDNLLGEDGFSQGINQWLKLYTGLPNPLRES